MAPNSLSPYGITEQAHAEEVREDTIFNYQAPSIHLLQIAYNGHFCGYNVMVDQDLSPEHAQLKALLSGPCKLYILNLGFELDKELQKIDMELGQRFNPLDAWYPNGETLEAVAMQHTIPENKWPKRLSWKNIKSEYAAVQLSIIKLSGDSHTSYLGILYPSKTNLRYLPSEHLRLKMNPDEVYPENDWVYLDQAPKTVDDVFATVERSIQSNASLQKASIETRVDVSDGVGQQRMQNGPEVHVATFTFEGNVFFTLDPDIERLILGKDSHNLRP
ncbi:hypothetical protein EJ05DRAFT_517566 [Pseudovirgaria hyperparasitica]|uniref:Uncharacterized protein n=1 Tax=Pseudovirgaria hyperparasitica TaxID=470096 RepID=A0A6A6W594_9PEZI|nr:uncharacterized protein EJ05DRAFT_517566 [Pseudovirgaria hyperparasitica]KAF2757100.1 hypothetical protein EJ05DRAFT_517566 [Pseudovirgaria hyperparasitica]